MAQEIADSKLLDTWGSSGTKIEPDITKIIEGWQLGEQPPHEYMNWLQNTFGSKLNHILKNGIAKWDDETEYLAGASVQHSSSIWLCETTNTNSEPTDLNANWEKVAINKDLTVAVDTLADLRSISYPANTVWASGYDTKNDGAFGSHIFRLKGVKTTETDNGGTVIIATVGGGVDYVYELQYDGAVNVKWFGAKGDGITDDTIPIQKAIDYCYSVRTIYDTKTVYLDNGTYIISNTLNIPSYTTLIGDGHNSVLKVKDNSNTFNVLSITQDGANNINIRDFSIHGNSANNTNLINALYIAPISSPCIYSVFQNLYIKEMSGSSLYLNNAGAERIRFIDCMFRDSVKNNVYSSHLKYASFDNCIVRTSKTGFSGLFLDGALNTDITIDNCLIEENALYGIYVSMGYKISIRNSTISYSGSTGVVIDRTNHLSLTDNLVHDNTGYGILIQGTSTAKIYYVMINSCSIYSNNLYGLYLDYCDGASIHSNNFTDNSDAYPNVNSAIYLQRSSLNSIMLNTFNGVSQKYAVDWDSATAKSNIIHKNNIISVGTDYINSLKHDSSNYIHLTRIASSLVAPSTGSWNIGDIVYNRSPSASGFIGWVCTAGGTPGTWKTFGAISA